MSFSSCFITSNVCKGCRDSIGGIRTAYIVAGCVTGTTENAQQEILTVGATGGTVYQFQVEKNTSNDLSYLKVFRRNFSTRKIIGGSISMVCIFRAVL